MIGTISRKILSAVCGVAGLMGVTFVLAPSAKAALILSANVGGTPFTCVDNTACDSNPAVGQISIPSTTINGVQVTGNFDNSAQSLLNFLSSASTNVINTNATSELITVAVGDTNYVPPVSGIDISGSGTFVGNVGNSIVLKWFADTANTQGATSPTTTPGTQIGSTFTFTSTQVTDSFSTTTSNVPFTATAPFSMTEQFQFTLAPGAQLTSRGQTEVAPTVVPEPASLAMLGVGLLGLGLVRRRKHS